MKYSWTLIELLLYASVVWAQDVPAIGHLGIEHGLSSDVVRCIYQDHDGYMWFGTRDGLDRYDGYGFKVFRNKLNDPHSLVHNIVHAITGDARHHLWIGTRQGVSVYTPLTGMFACVKYLRPGQKTAVQLKDVIKEVIPDAKGNMLIGSESLGLLYCKDAGLIARLIPLFREGKDPYSYGVQAIKTSPDGNIWVFVQNVGLCRLDSRSMQLDVLNKDVVSVNCMETDTKGVYLGTSSGLYRYDSGHHKMEGIDLPALKDQGKAINSLTLDRSGILWIGTTDGAISRYYPDRQVLKIQTAFRNDGNAGMGSVYCITEDKDHRKWIGTSLGGIRIIDPNKKKFQTIVPSAKGQNPLTEAISAFYEESKDKFWVGTENSGIYIWDRKDHSFAAYRHNADDPFSVSSNFITSIIRDDQDNIWVGTFASGLNRFDRTKNGFDRYKCINPETGVENKVVFTLYRDNNKNIWAGTLRQGSLMGALYVFDPGQDKFQLFDTRLSDLFTMNEDAQGTLWGGNLSQLVKIDKTTKKQHRFYPIGYTVRAIYDDRHGHLWVGTEGGGLVLFDRKSHRIAARYTTEDGLSNNSVLTLIDDGAGNLWMSTYNGIAKFNMDRRTFTNFYQSDGLQSNQFQINAGIKLSTQELAFGGVKGFDLFLPSDILPANTSPGLVMTDIHVNGLKLERNLSYVNSATEERPLEIKVPYSDAVFSFDYTALEYSAPDKISYAYFMEGWDRKWNPATHNRTANYTHMSEGEYTLYIKSTNAEGVWSRPPLSLKIIILPPWYRTWWAYAVYAGVAALLFYLFILYKTRQTKLQFEVELARLDARRRTAEYEKERAINEKEKEINEGRLSFFTNISHEFRTPLTLIINPVDDLIKNPEAGHTETQQGLDVIHRNARRMLSLVDQLLLFRQVDSGFNELKTSKFNFYQLLDEVYQYFVQQANHKQINYGLAIENKNLKIYADRAKLEIVLFNLVSNALKYTAPHGTVNLVVSETETEILLTVQDTGYGIPDDARERIFERFYQAKRTDKGSKPGFGIGLYLAKQFTEAHGGELTYKSKMGAGSTFFLKLLKENRHLSPLSPEDSSDIAAVRTSMLIAPSANVPAVTDAPTLAAYIKDDLISDKKTLLIVDDDTDTRQYIKEIFRKDYTVCEAGNGELGLQMIRGKLPDLIITDYKMQGLDGMELCEKVKSDPSLSFIPVILLTAHSSQDLKLKSLEGGADDYISKPFEREYLMVKVANLLKNKNYLQNYFYNKITLKPDLINVSEEYKKFLERCMAIVEDHLNDPDFGIGVLAHEIGMSHSNLYKRVKSISGQSVSAFIRFIRLRKAAEMMINTNCNVSEAAFRTGFNDAKYFSKQFQKLFQSTPSDFIKKYRQSFSKKYKRNSDPAAFKYGKGID